MLKCNAMQVTFVIKKSPQFLHSFFKVVLEALYLVMITLSVKILGMEVDPAPPAQCRTRRG